MPASEVSRDLLAGYQGNYAKTTYSQTEQELVSLVKSAVAASP